MTSRIEVVVAFLNTCNIECSTLDELIGREIPREVLLSAETYRKAQEAIPSLKSVFSSSFMTGLQANAARKQKWPLLNMVRQVLATQKIRLEPVRRSNGYDANGKKIYKRFFVVQK